MPGISITTTVFDVDGSLYIKARNIESDTDLTAKGHRITRTPTLDGSAAFEDLGLSHADRTLTMRFKGLTRAEYEQLANMVEIYSWLDIQTGEGAFTGAPAEDAIRRDGNITTLKILVKEMNSL